MKKFPSNILTTLVFIIIVITKIGFSQWIPINPVPQSNQLTQIFAFDSTSAVAVGDNGTIIKTTNSGTNWMIQYNVGGASDYFYSVSFADINTGWCVGYNIIVKTTDGGNSWTTQQFPGFVITPRFNSVYFINNNTGWAVGGYGSMVKTTNGGNNWFKQYYNGASHNSVFFINNNTGWMTSGEPGLTFSGGYVSKTSNGGNNWNRLQYSSGFQDTVMYSIYFVDNNTGWTGGYGGRIYKTTNGGSNWSNQSSNLVYIINSIYFINTNTGWIVGPLGKILSTSNGGNNWFVLPSGTSSALNSVKFTDNRNGWCVGDIGTILRTTNGGSTAINPVSIEIPEQFILSQNYPNPFNPSTTIKFEIPIPSFTTLSVYNMLGELIEILLNERLSSGKYSVEWNGENINSGLYFYKLKTDKYTATRKMLLIK